MTIRCQQQGFNRRDSHIRVAAVTSGDFLPSSAAHCLLPFSASRCKLHLMVGRLCWSFRQNKLWGVGKKCCFVISNVLCHFSSQDESAGVFLKSGQIAPQGWACTLSVLCAVSISFGWWASPHSPLTSPTYFLADLCHWDFLRWIPTPSRSKPVSGCSRQHKASPACGRLWLPRRPQSR